MWLQELSRIRRLARGYLLGRPRHHDLATSVAAFRSKIDDVVGGLDDVHVMLDQEHGVAGVDELVE